MAHLKFMHDDILGTVEYSISNTKHLWNYLVISPLDVQVSQEPVANYTCAITCSAGGWTIIPHPQHKIFVDNVFVIGFKMLSHHNIIKVDGINLYFEGEVIETLAQDDRAVTKRLRCPYSRLRLKADMRVVHCPRCQRVHTLNGWLALQECGQRDCKYPIKMQIKDVVQDEHSKTAS